MNRPIFFSIRFWGAQDVTGLQKGTQELSELLEASTSLDSFETSLETKTVNRILAVVNQYSVDERHAILNTLELRHRINSLAPISAISVNAALLVGSQNWQQLANTTDFVNHFTLYDREIPLSYSATMNCFEMLLYAAFLTGEITRSQIEEYYNNSTFYGLPDSQRFFSNLGWRENLPDYQGLARVGKSSVVPRVGDLVFFSKIENNFFTHQQEYKTTHVALSIGGDLVISLHANDFSLSSIDPVRRVRIADLPDVGDFIVQVGDSITSIF